MKTESRDLTLSINDTTYKDLALRISRYKNNTPRIQIFHINDDENIIQEICEMTIFNSDLKGEEILLNSDDFPFINEMVDTFALAEKTAKQINGHTVYRPIIENINNYAQDIDEII